MGYGPLMRPWRALMRRFTASVLGFSSETAPRPVDRVIMEMAGSGASPTVGRKEALSVPAVQRGRNLICSISTLPLVQYGPNQTIVPNALLEQIDPDVANVVTLAQTLEDLLFDSISWWKITAFGWDGYPVKARHLDVGTVSLDPPAGRTLAPLPSGWDPREAAVWVDGEPVPASKIIRFDSPNPAVLTVGGRAIRRAILLDKLASTYADDPRPLDYFTAMEGADPEDDEVKSFLDTWKAARKKRSTAYVPSSLKYNTVSAPSPTELQLAELQKKAGLDIANALGIDPEELGISTTSRTYANATDRRKDRVNDVLSPFMLAITQRLSMGDVTKRGHMTEFDLDNYMKPDPKTRAEVQRAYLDMKVITVGQIAAEEKYPAPVVETPAETPVEEPAADATEDTADTAGGAKASRNPVHVLVGARRFADETGPKMTFDGGDFIGFAEAATVDVETRTITGLAVPYNRIARKYGLAFRFRPGSLKYADISRVKHYKDHYIPVGVHESVKETAKGPIVKLKVLDGPEGSPAKLERDQLLYDAAHGLYDGLSIGVDFSLDPAVGDVEWNEKDKVYDVLRADWRETSSTPMPAFDDARVTKVAASSNRVKGRSGMPDEEIETPESQSTPPAPGGLTLSQDQMTALLSRPGALDALVQAQVRTATPATPVPAGGLTLSAEQVDGLIRAGQLGTLLGMPQLTQGRTEPEPERRTAVDPTRRTAALSVREPAPYRFDRKGNLIKGSHDFSTDLIAGGKGDKASLDRVQTFVVEHFEQEQSAAFDVDKADVAALNPSRNRPDLYVDQREYRYPVWASIEKGPIADATPFVIPKFNSSSGLVAAHTEGVEPTPGTFTATSQTITPTPVSGKVQITRVAWDQGGNPQTSGLIWRQMERAWYEALEAAAVAVLDAATPTAIALTAGGGTTGQTLDSELTAAFAGLQFVRGGFAMDTAFAQIDLYKALVAAKDDDGRRLYPAVGPMNASGQVNSRYAAIDVNGVLVLPSWALAATGSVVASSYLFDRETVHGWATTPRRLEFEYTVDFIELAIWGYKATAITDISGVREITYDPVP